MCFIDHHDRVLQDLLEITALLKSFERRAEELEMRVGELGAI